MKFSYLVTLSAVLLATQSNRAFASSPNFQNLSSSDFTSIMNDFSALSSYTSVSGASGRGSIFGFEVGVIGSVTETPNVNSVAKKIDSSASIPMMPDAALLGAISIPGGIGFEVTLLPGYTANGVSLQQYGGAVQYGLMSFPINLSIKAHFTKTTFNFTESTGGGTGTVKFDDTMYGADLLAGKDLIFFEPYVGLGYATSTANLSETGTSTQLFNYTTSQSQSTSPSSARFLVGVNFHLLLINLGAEYLRTFGTDRISLKLSAGF